MIKMSAVFQARTRERQAFGPLVTDGAFGLSEAGWTCGEPERDSQCNG